MSNSTLRLPGRIAVFAVAHPKYWSQFPTLREKLEGYHAEPKGCGLRCLVLQYDYIRHIFGFCAHYARC